MAGLIRVTNIGKLKKTRDFLEGCCKLTDKIETGLLHAYGEQGVALLSQATPRDTGKTAASWTYEIERTSKGAILRFNNINVNEGVNIALILQYGHGTRNGGYVQGIDYINPVLAQEFQKFADGVFWEVQRL